MIFNAEGRGWGYNNRMLRGLLCVLGVVCRCGEDLAWTRNVPRGLAVTVYDKTPPPGSPWPGSTPLPNVGREAHAWLHHLADRYDSLPDWTIFAQGHPFVS